MTYEEYMSLGLLPDGTNTAPPPVNRDTLSEAHALQLAFNDMYDHHAHSHLYPFGNYYGPNGDNHYGVLPNLTSEGVFAGRIETMALEAPLTPPDDVLGIGDQVLAMLGFERTVDDEPDVDPYYDPSGFSTDPGLPMFDGSFSAPAAAPDMFVPHGDINPRVYGFEDDTISGLADALGPDVSSVSRLGGPFAGYTTDALTARLRDLVRRA